MLNQFPNSSCRSVFHKIIVSLRAERRRREARCEKFSHENCTLSTIHLGPAGRKAGLCLVMMVMKIRYGGRGDGPTGGTGVTDNMLQQV